MQGQTGVFAERMQGRHLYVLGYSVSVFGNSASMLIAMLGLSGHINGYQTTVAVARNNTATPVTDPTITALTAINPVRHATISTTMALASYATTSVATILAS